jgi:hypothetical protein
MSLFENPDPDPDPFPRRPGESHAELHLRRLREDPDYAAAAVALFGRDKDGKGYTVSPSSAL